MNREYIGKSNPYITVSIDNSFELGKNFQLKAKISSSVETSWGGWIKG